MLQKYQEAYVNFLGIFLKVFRLKSTKQNTSFIKNGIKILHIFFIRFYYATRLENIKKVIKNLWKFIWSFLKKFWYAGGVNSMQCGAHSKNIEEKRNSAEKLGPGPYIT
jgi:hypothetical protein